MLAPDASPHLPKAVLAQIEPVPRAVGEFAETWDSSAQEAFQRASKKEIKVEFDEDVEMA